MRFEKLLKRYSRIFHFQKHITFNIKYNVIFYVFCFFGDKSNTYYTYNFIFVCTFVQFRISERNVFHVLLETFASPRPLGPKQVLSERMFRRGESLIGRD